MITTLTIENFKSIKKLDFKPKRINLFVGAPNVGKSNILEALSLFSLPSAMSDKFLKDLVRFDNFRNLFYDNIINSNIKISTNKSALFCKYSTMTSEMGVFKLLCENLFLDNSSLDVFFEDTSRDLIELGREKEKIYSKNNKIEFWQNILYDKGDSMQKPVGKSTFIKKYRYKDAKKFDDGFDKYLRTPFGENLNTMIQINSELMNEFASFFEKYNLFLSLDIEKNVFYIQKQVNRITYNYPFDLIADSLKRLIFYSTAIETNKKSCLLLEEPEVHSYPPYVKFLSKKIVENKENQYFITTHSPYLLSGIIENTDYKDLNLIITYYEDYQTKIKILNKEEIGDFLDLDSDVFFNFDKFLD